MYISLWHKHFHVNFTLIFTLVPAACLGYVLQEMSVSLVCACLDASVLTIGRMDLFYGEIAYDVLDGMPCLLRRAGVPSRPGSWPSPTCMTRW